MKLILFFLSLSLLSQALNPILVLILIPLYDGVIYPIFERCQMPLRYP